MGRQSSILSFFGKPNAKTPTTESTAPFVPSSQESSESPGPANTKRKLFGLKRGLNDDEKVPEHPAIDSRFSAPSRTKKSQRPVGRARSAAMDVDETEDDVAIASFSRAKQGRRTAGSHSAAKPVSAGLGDDDDDVDFQSVLGPKRDRKNAPGSSSQKRKAGSEMDDDEALDSFVRKANGGKKRRLRRVSESDNEDEGNPQNPQSSEMQGDSDATSPGLGAYLQGNAPMPGVPRARSRLDALDLSGGHSEEKGGWCDKNPWSVKIRDSMKRSPGHEDYDPSTLFIPRSVLDRMTPFQKQFWELKCKYYNTMLFVKKGAFMEAYDIDADIVHKELGLNYTGGGRAAMRCAGVPEGALNRHAARLIDLGYRVGVVVQTETANAADKRKAKAGSAGVSTSKICNRVLVRILTKATVTDDELLMDHRARYVVALIEADESTTSSTGDIVVGVCHIDAASGRITLGEFVDDNRRSWSEKLLLSLRPPELIVPLKSKMSVRMRGLIRWVSTGSVPVDIMYQDEKRFTPMTSTWLGKYQAGVQGKSDGNSSILSPSYFEKHPQASLAFGAVASYLGDLKIDKELLSLGNYTILPPVELSKDESGVSGSDGVDESESAMRQDLVGSGASSDDTGYDHTRALAGGLQMDAATMANLEVLANVVDGSERGTLISVIDKAATASGRRLLRRWISDPLSNSAAINDRLNAVESLLSVDDSTLGEVRRLLRSGPDIERALTRLHQFAVVEDVAVMFDDSNARRVKAFVKVLRGLQSTLRGLEQLSSSLPSPCKGQRLAWLASAGEGFPASASEDLRYFLESAFDVSVAEKEGEMCPKAGGAPKFEKARAVLDSVECQLQDELEKWQRNLGDRSIKFYNRGKENFQLEVKNETLKKQALPRGFTPVSESKSAKRFYTRTIQDLVRHHVDASEAFATASVNVLRDVVSLFDEKRDSWSAIVSVSAELDALIGLTLASQEDGSGPMVRPVVLPEDHPEPVFEAEDLRHPVLAAKAGAAFVSNDTVLGGGSETIALLTGSNCSGKSTLSRQVAGAVLLAQIGAYVPARTFRLRPFRSVFARAGSRDEIARGRSTFFVEMEEAALIANTATDRSLVIVDELCSGTTAQDAHAISHAMLDHLLKVGCLTVFCTHADALALEFKGRVGNYTMAADINEEKKTIVFLYKMIRGVTSHSRGVFCGRVAGIPSYVADRAEQASNDFETALTSRREVASIAKLLRDVESGQSIDMEALRLVAGLH